MLYLQHWKTPTMELLIVMHIVSQLKNIFKTNHSEESFLFHWQQSMLLTDCWLSMDISDVCIIIALVVYRITGPLFSAFFSIEQERNSKFYQQTHQAVKETILQLIMLFLCWVHLWTQFINDIDFSCPNMFSGIIEQTSNSFHLDFCLVIFIINLVSYYSSACQDQIQD